MSMCAMADINLCYKCGRILLRKDYACEKCKEENRLSELKQSEDIKALRDLKHEVGDSHGNE